MTRKSRKKKKVYHLLGLYKPCICKEKKHLSLSIKLYIKKNIFYASANLILCHKLLPLHDVYIYIYISLFVYSSNQSYKIIIYKTCTVSMSVCTFILKEGKKKTSRVKIAQ